MGREAESSVTGHLSIFLSANPPAKAFALQKCMSTKPCVVNSLFCRNRVESWLKEHAFISWYRGSFIRAFPLPNYMPHKPGRSNPSLSLHQELFNSTCTSTYVQISRVPSVPVGPKCERLKWKRFPASNVDVTVPHIPFLPKYVQKCREPRKFCFLFKKSSHCKKNKTNKQKQTNEQKTIQKG